MTRTAVCILGFHRSGTSMTTRLVNLLGVELGDDLLVPDHENPRGYWEPHWMVRLNDRILDAVGAHYMHPPRRDAPWQSLTELRERAGELLDEHFGELTLFGFKDPRLCLTWPFWRDLVADRVDTVKHVICLRSPAETAASMISRDRYPGVTHADWGNLWLDYTGRALAATHHEDRHLVIYDDLLANGTGEAWRLAHFLGVTWPDRARAEELQASIDVSLRHHAARLTDTVADDRLPASARAVFSSLAAAATVRRNGDDHLAQALEGSAEALWREQQDALATAGVLDVHREALVDAIGELQQGHRREDWLFDELVRSRGQLTEQDAELAQARSDLRSVRG